MVDFTKIKTKFVLNKLKETDDKEYVEQLLKLEHFMVEQPTQLFACMQFGTLKKTYEDDYFEILKEIDPQSYVKMTQLGDWNKKIKVAEENLENLKEGREKAESEITWNLMKERDE